MLKNKQQKTTANKTVKIANKIAEILAVSKVKARAIIRLTKVL